MSWFETKREPRKLGIALGSGGARGMALLGVLERFTDWGLPIHCVAGTSIGAIIGAIYVSGKLKEAIEWSQNLNWLGAAAMFAEINLPKQGLLKGRRIEERLRNFITLPRYEDSPVPFATVSTNIATGEEVVLKTGELLKGVQASFAIPGVFVPIERDGCQLVDGGMVNPMPISVCRDLGADAVIAVDINLRKGPEGYRREKHSLNIFEILTNTISIFEREVTRSTICSQAPNVCIQPAVGDIYTLDFRTAATAIEAGRVAADEMRKDIEALLAD